MPESPMRAARPHGPTTPPPAAPPGAPDIPGVSVGLRRAPAPSALRPRDIALALAVLLFGLALTALTAGSIRSQLLADARARLAHDASLGTLNARAQLVEPMGVLHGLRGLYEGPASGPEADARAAVLLDDALANFALNGVRLFGRLPVDGPFDARRARVLAAPVPEPEAAHRATLAADPALGAAVARAVAEGRIVLHTLPGDGAREPSWLMLLPVRGPAGGVVYALLAVDDLSAHTGQQTGVPPRLRLGEGGRQEDWPAGAVAAEERLVDFPNHRIWLQVFASAPDSHVGALPAGAAVTGTLLSVLLAVLVARLADASRRAEQQVVHRTIELEAAQREVRRLARVAELTSDGVIVTDAPGQIVWVNAAFTRMFEIPADEAIGRRAWRLLAEDAADPAVAARVREQLAAGRPCRDAVAHRTRGGNRSWLDFEIQPIRDADTGDGTGGAITGHVAVVRDVTAYRQATEDLALQRQWLANIVDSTRAGTWRWDLRSGEVTVDERWAGLIGTTVEALGPLTAERVMSLLHPEDAARAIDEFKAYAHGAVAHYDVEVRMRHADGHWVWAHNRAKFFDRSADGRPASMAGTLMDITARRQAEAEVGRLEALLRGALEAVNEAFVVFDADDRIVYLNDRFRRMWDPMPLAVQPGMRFEDLLRGAVAHGVFPVSAGGAEAFIAARLAAHRRGDFTPPTRLASGRVIRSIDRRMPDGHTVGFRIDVTELVEAKEAAEAAAVARARFLAMMSHEIRTPMNAVLGLLQLLRRTPLTAQQGDYASKTEAAARSLLGLLNDILDYSKAEAGRMTLEAQPFALDRVLDDLAVILAGSVGDKPLDLVYDLDPRLPVHLVGDAMRLRQALVNLGGNAVKFTERGQVVVRLTLLDDTAAAVRIRFEVQDTGIGIAPEHQRTIFEGFSQAESSTTRRFGGTGLGLAISRQLLALMGARLAVDSAPGAGSRFHFDLALPRAPTADRTESIVSGARAIAAAWPPQRVLVVDDNPVGRAATARTAAALGWQVDAVDDGLQALARAAAARAAGEPYTLALLDERMPVLDGPTMAARLARAARGKGGPRAAGAAAPTRPRGLLLTAHARPALAGPGAGEDDSGVDGVLVRPMTPLALVRAAAAVLAPSIDDTVAAVRRSSASADAPLAPAAPVGARPLEGLRILLVEDNAINRQVASELLAAEGARVALACDGRQGVDAVKASVAAGGQPYDVVLMDLQMPVLDGVQATVEIRADPRVGALPIVAMTANAQSSDRDACLAAGMNEHVAKPFDLEAVVALLRRLAGRAPIAASRPACDGGFDVLAARAQAGGLDFAGAFGRAGRRVDTFATVLRMFVAEAPGMVDEAERLHAAGLRVDAVRQVHTLKGLAGTVGAVALRAAAAEVEQRLRDDETGGADLTAANLAVLLAPLRAGLVHLLPLLAGLADGMQPDPAATTT